LKKDSKKNLAETQEHGEKKKKHLWGKVRNPPWEKRFKQDLNIGRETGKAPDPGEPEKKNPIA